MNFDFFGGYYAVLGILVVYQVFSLQVWLGRSYEVSDAGEEAKGRSAKGAPQRERARRRCESVLRQFPWIPSAVVCTAVGIIVGLVIGASMNLAVCWVYSYFPAVMLLVVYITITLITYIVGRKALKRIIGEL